MTESPEIVDRFVGDYMRKEVKTKLELCRVVFPGESEAVILKCLELSASPFYWWKEAVKPRER